MRALISSYNNTYLALVRVALERERIGFRDTGDNAFAQDPVLPTEVYVLNDADYDRACAVIRRLNDETRPVQSALPQTTSTRIVSRVFIGIIALAVISIIVAFIHEAIRAYHS